MTEKHQLHDACSNSTQRRKGEKFNAEAQSGRGAEKREKESTQRCKGAKEEKRRDK
jgi:hypothetical protein